MNKKEIHNIAKDFIANNVQVKQGQPIYLVAEPENMRFAKAVRSELKKLGAGYVTVVTDAAMVPSAAEETANQPNEAVENEPLTVMLVPEVEDGVILDVRNLKKHFVPSF